MTALFRMKWGHKPQVVQSKIQTPVPHLPSEDDDDDEEKLSSGAPIRRNSRFYRSMRKKKLSSSSEQQESENYLYVLFYFNTRKPFMNY